MYKSNEICLHAITKMESIRNVVIVGCEDGNPSRFITQIEPVKLPEDSEMAITSLYHGEVFNIHSGNNKVYFYGTNDRQLSMEIVKHFRGKPTSTAIPNSMQGFELPAPTMVTVPEGSYNSSITLCWVISNLIKEKLGVLKKRDAMNPTADKQYNIVNIDMSNLYMVIEGKTDTPWTLMGVHEDKYARFTIEDKDFHCSHFPAFVYASIIENSYINGKLTRNLCIVPIKSGPQWSLYEPTYPNYVPINVKQFSKILIELRDIKGQYIKFDPMFKTVMTLSIRPIKRQ